MGENELPPHLREALARELDEGETLRWAGVPDAALSARRIWKSSIAWAVLSMVMGAGIGYGAWHFCLEAIGAIPLTSGQRPVPVVGLVLAAGVSVLQLLGAYFVFLKAPGAAAAAARRTVFAVTGTRVMSLVVNPDGTVVSESFEPGHPLFVARREIEPDVGDVFFVPGARRQAEARRLGLTSLRNVRHVERVIRQTFDPPGVKA